VFGDRSGPGHWTSGGGVFAAEGAGVVMLDVDEEALAAAAAAAELCTTSDQV